tara:strand:+ start:242 stop:457 length:216 start_codon:yes stop_codon:yes gene_type:complete
MAQISKELLEREWDTYNGLRNFLNYKKLLFGDEMNRKYRFLDDSLIPLDDHAAYLVIKDKHTIDIDALSKR